MKNIIFSGLSVALMATAASSSAATAPGSFEVGASVQSSCVIVSSDNVNAGLYDSVNIHKTTAYQDSLFARGLLRVRCTAGTTNVKVSMDDGLNPQDISSCHAPFLRLISKNGDYLRYWVNSYGTETWKLENGGVNGQWGCEGANIKEIKNFQSSVDSIEMGVEIRIFGGQNAPIGSYTDTVGVSLVF